jgi:shikimate kinase
MKKNSIALIGFMATGKTTVGQALRDYLGDNYKFIETDQIVIQIAGKSIPRIFNEDGEKTFREYEIEACKRASRFNNVIISCGGGVVLNKVNIDNLKKNCNIVLLEASEEEIYKRAMKDGRETRPVIDKKDAKAEIKKVLDFRRSLYNKAAEFIIKTDQKEIEDIVSEIIDKTKLQQR